MERKKKIKRQNGKDRNEEKTKIEVRVSVTHRQSMKERDLGREKNREMWGMGNIFEET